MKKSSFALAALSVLAAAAAMPAAAQVSVFGTVDANVTVTDTNFGADRTYVSNSGLTKNRLGFKGEENLGSGLKASFHLEQGFDENGVSTAGFAFNRRSTVSLHGGFGEVRVGRDFKPTYVANSAYDPFGATGAGSAQELLYTSMVSAPSIDAVRSPNLVSYFSPDIHGLKFQLSASPSEGVNGGEYTGARAVYNHGPFEVQAAYGLNKVTGGDLKQSTVGGSYDAGMFKAMGSWTKTQGNLGESVSYTVGGNYKVGANGELRGSYVTTDVMNNSVDQFALGYVHNFSKRTAVYGTAAFLESGSDRVNLYQAGIRHNF